jgi:diguanylate cyclase (GGDEF)-like protein
MDVTVLRDPRPFALLSGVQPTSVACLHFDKKGRLTVFNSPAEAFFGISVTRNISVMDLMGAAETAGTLCIGDGQRIAALIAKHSSRFFFETRDGRYIMCNKFTGDEGLTADFIDVSEALAIGKSLQRDDLTGVSSRQELIRALTQRMKAETPDQAAVLYIDLDRFKMVNDTLGHPVGDNLLKLVTQRVAAEIDSRDMLARVGGDEFAVLQFAGAQPEAAARLAGKIVEMVSRTYLIGGQVIQIGCSIGISLVRPDTRSADDLIRNADIALLKAKTDGRGVVRHFTDAMHQELAKKRGLEIDLRRALALQEFALVYQPQFKIDGQKLTGFEALLRWHNEERGFVSPGEFIPLAEEMGLIGPLGEWVIRSACREAAAWSEPLTIAVNLSPLQFRSGNLVNVVVSALANASLEPNRLELEITEGALLENTDAVIQTLQQLKSIGVKISMDDFGTGYSSLGYLQRFPFDKIKIDQSFVRELATSSQSQAIVAAVIELGRGLGMVTIAEGVETTAQLEALASIGCNQVQGFLTGRPTPHEDVIALIKTAFPKGEPA